MDKKNASQYLKHKKENRDYHQFNDVKNFLLDLSTDKSSEDPFYFHRVTYDLFHSIAADEAAEFQKGAIVDGIQHFLIEPKHLCEEETSHTPFSKLRSEGVMR